MSSLGATTRNHRGLDLAGLDGRQTSSACAFMSSKSPFVANGVSVFRSSPSPSLKAAHKSADACAAAAAAAPCKQQGFNFLLFHTLFPLTFWRALRFSLPLLQNIERVVRLRTSDSSGEVRGGVSGVVCGGGGAQAVHEEMRTHAAKSGGNEVGWGKGGGGRVGSRKCETCL